MNSTCLLDREGNGNDLQIKFSCDWKRSARRSAAEPEIKPRIQRRYEKLEAAFREVWKQREKERIEGAGLRARVGLPMETD